MRCCRSNLPPRTATRGALTQRRSPLLCSALLSVPAHLPAVVALPSLLSSPVPCLRVLSFVVVTTVSWIHGVCGVNCSAWHGSATTAACSCVHRGANEDDRNRIIRSMSVYVRAPCTITHDQHHDRDTKTCVRTRCTTTQVPTHATRPRPPLHCASPSLPSATGAVSVPVSSL